MPKVWIYKPKNEQSVSFIKAQDLIEQVTADLIDNSGGWLDEPGQEVTIKVVEMTQAEIDAMPEFLGW